MSSEIWEWWGSRILFWTSRLWVTRRQAVNPEGLQSWGASWQVFPGEHVYTLGLLICVSDREQIKFVSKPCIRSFTSIVTFSPYYSPFWWGCWGLELRSLQHSPQKGMWNCRAPSGGCEAELSYTNMRHPWWCLVLETLVPSLAVLSMAVRLLFLLLSSFFPVGKSMQKRKSCPIDCLLRFRFCSVVWEMFETVWKLFLTKVWEVESEQLPQ